MENILVQKLKEYRMLYVFCMLVHIVLAVELTACSCTCYLDLIFAVLLCILWVRSA